MDQMDKLAEAMVDIGIPFEACDYKAASTIVITAGVKGATGPEGGWVEFKFDEDGKFTHVGVYPRAITNEDKPRRALFGPPPIKGAK